MGLLLVDEDNRPVPDQIVSHPFFKTHWVPEALNSNWTSVAPVFPNNGPPGATEIAQGYSFSWYKACQQSGVGEYAPGCVFSVVGLGNIASIFKDIEKEIKAGRAPTVPIAPTTVYLPFISEQKEKSLYRPRRAREVIVEQPSTHISTHLTEISGNADTIARALPIRRAPSRNYQENAKLEPKHPTQPDAKDVAPVRKRAPTRAHTERPAIKNTQPLPTIMTIRPLISASQSETLVPISRQRTACPQDVQPLISDISSQIPQPVSSSLAKSQQQVNGEALMLVANNGPTTVLLRATQLRDQLLMALQSRSRLKRSANTKQTLPFVSKWVDYAKKHGVGYVLADGTIGCTFVATPKQPVLHIIARNGRNYLESDRADSASEKVPLQFFSVDSKGSLDIYNPQSETLRRNSVLWTKFGRYMCQTLSTGSERKSPDSDGCLPIVRFYQRVGPVGVWHFTDGCIQVRYCNNKAEIVKD